MSRETFNSINEARMIPCERHCPSPLNSSLSDCEHPPTKCLPKLEDTWQELSEVNNEERWKRAVDGVLHNVHSYQEKRKFALRNIVTTREAMDQRIYQLQLKEKELSEEFINLQNENTDLKEILKLQKEKEDRFQKSENERKQKEGHPGEMRPLIRTIEDTVDKLVSIQNALDEHIKKFIGKSLPSEILEEFRATKRQMETNRELSDRATMAVQSVNQSYERLLVCVPVMHQKLVSLQNQLDQERNVGRETESNMEYLELKLQNLNRDLEGLYQIYKQTGTQSEIFQNTIEDLQSSIGKCRESIDQIDRHSLE